MKTTTWIIIYLLLIATIPAFGSEPSLTVKKYLADRKVFISAEGLAVVEQKAYGRAERLEAATLLKSKGVKILNELRQGVSIIKSTDAEDPDIADITTQIGAHLSPILIKGDPRLKVIPLLRVVFSLKEGAELTAVLEKVDDIPYRLSNGTYATDMADTADEWASLELAAELSELPGVAWAVPDCLRDVKKHYLLNDIDNLWYLHNTNTVSSTNSSALAKAWDTSLGSPEIVIAILDDAIDIMHPDISPNVWTNSLETPGDGVDNDGNGYIDDVTGWDFYAGTNVVYPTDPEENHGTSTAGLAASRGNNALGVSGACPQCTLLPVKLFGGNNMVTDSQWAQAIQYANRYAHIISMSLGTSAALEAQLVSALNNASTSSLIMASSANNGDVGWYETECPSTPSSGTFYGWLYHTNTAVGSGSHTYRWSYIKDTTVSEPYDCAWVDAITFPDGTTQDFESGSWPAGWTTGGEANWYLSPEAADSMVVGAYSMRSGEIDDSQSAWLEVSVAGAGAVSFYYQVLGEMSCDVGDNVAVWDGLEFTIDSAPKLWDANQDVEGDWGFNPWNVNNPAALTSVVAVGGNTIDGYRSTYSCFGTNIEVVAPTSGSTWERKIRTTDRVGTEGYSTTNYTDAFGGTSASCPIAAGIAGLIWSANPHLTPHELRQLIRDSARKIGYVPYSSGFNTRYGYGQITAASAMGLMLSNMAPEFVQIEDNGSQVRFRAMGIETNRAYHIYGATNVVGEAWGWQDLTPGGVPGAPVFGTNTTPWMAADGARVFRIQK